jgi:hypothetical protein
LPIPHLVAEPVGVVDLLLRPSSGVFDAFAVVIVLAAIRAFPSVCVVW